MSSNKDYLSQEEIDALLKQSAEEAEGGSGAGSSDALAGIDEYLTPMEQDALGEIGNITFGSAATALSTLLGKKVDITTPKVSIIYREELESVFPKPHVAVHVRYVDGFQGINSLVIKVRDAQVIADLMLGGDGNPVSDELNEIHISAVQEAMNQMMGSSATSMSTIFNRFVNISPPGIDILNVPNGQGTESLPREDAFVKISFRLMIGDLIDSTLMQLLPVDFAKSMVSILLGGEEQAAPEPAPAPASSGTGMGLSDFDDLLSGANTNYNFGDAPATPPVQQQPYSQPVYQEPMQQQMVQQPGYQQPMYQQPPMMYQQQQPHTPQTIGGLPGNRNVNVQPVQFSGLGGGPAYHTEESNLNLLLDIPLKVTVELGRTQKQIKDILELSQGSIIELDKLEGEPVDILVNNKLIAKGEVVVIDENFGVRVTDIISQWDRIQKLK